MENGAMKKILVTGGCGFIGANFVRVFLETTNDITLLNMDSLTYAGDVQRLRSLKDDPRHVFIKADICDKAAVEEAFSGGLDGVVHFAAESHVDRSIDDAGPFLRTNVMGTLTLLEVARKFNIRKFIHISTDEVYGDLGKTGVFTEQTPINPSSPYSASKASGDLLVKAFERTYGLQAVIVRPSNNYGPWQYPEKLIPVVISRAVDNQAVPVYAQGKNVREWLFVKDCARAVITVLDKGASGEIYNVGSKEERQNIEVVKAVLAILGKPESLIEYVADRPGHDFRYSLDSGKLRAELGWRPETGFEAGIEQTVKWYMDNEPWWRGRLAL